MLQLCERVLGGVCFEDGVLGLQLRYPLHQLGDLLLQHFYFFPHSEHEVRLDQVLGTRRENDGGVKYVNNGKKKINVSQRVILQKEEDRQSARATINITSMTRVIIIQQKNNKSLRTQFPI